MSFREHSGRLLIETQQDRASRQKAAEHAKLVARYESLTLRKREALPLLVKGLLDKHAAFELGITDIPSKSIVGTLCER